MQHRLLLSLAVLSIAAFFYDVQAAPATSVALRDASTGVIDTTGAEDSTSVRVKRQGGGCGCCGCGCCGCGGGGGGCGCCCCRPRCCCCCRRCCTCCRTCCCTRCCTCCRPCCCGCGCGCCGCGGGGRKRRSLQNLRIKLAEKLSALLPSDETTTTVATVVPEAPAQPEASTESPAQPEASESPVTPDSEKLQKRDVIAQTDIGAIVDVPEWPNSYGYY